MNSMTGYGRAVVETGPGDRIIAEVGSVNRKQTDIALSLPRELSALEPEIRKFAASRVARGRITIGIQFVSARSALLEVDEAAALEAAEAFRRIGTRLGLADSLTLDTVLRAPGVVRECTVELDASALEAEVRNALAGAFDAMQKMRAAEGRTLARDFRARCRTLAKLVTAIRRIARKVPARQRALMQERLARLGVGIDLSDDRLVREIGLFADRSDITEELTRLGSHLTQFSEQLGTSGPVGRTLEFISQEMFRELNTIGTKAGDADISRFVVDAKTELDRIREQLANVE